MARTSRCPAPKPRCAGTRYGKCRVSLDDATVALLRARLGVETNSGVRKEIATDLALAALDGPDPKARLDAVDTLSHSVSQDVRNRVALLSNT